MWRGTREERRGEEEGEREGGRRRVTVRGDTCRKAEREGTAITERVGER